MLYIETEHQKDYTTQKVTPNWLETTVQNSNVKSDIHI